MLVYLLDNIISHDLLLILVVISLIIISIVMVYLVYFQNKQLTKELLKKIIKKDDTPDNENLDLQELAKKLENIPKNQTMNLTQFEQDQEEDAIISYDELIKNKNNNKQVNNSLQDNYVDTREISHSIKQVQETESYEHEEEFLNNLKQLLYMLNK